MSEMNDEVIKKLAESVLEIEDETGRQWSGWWVREREGEHVCAGEWEKERETVTAPESESGCIRG